MSQHPSPNQLRLWSDGRLSASESKQIETHLATCTDVCLTVLEGLTPADGMATLTPGVRPLPDYELVRNLGAGGFGVVWQARGPGGLDLAMKFIRLQDRSGALELRALDVVKSIRHPNLVSLFGAWHMETLLILAMELCDRSLHERLSARPSRRDRPRVVTASEYKTARVWDATTGEACLAPLQHDDKVERAMFSPDGKEIVTSSRDGTARLWDAVTGKELKKVAITPN